MPAETLADFLQNELDKQVNGRLADDNQVDDDVLADAAISMAAAIHGAAEGKHVALKTLASQATSIDLHEVLSNNIDGTLSLWATKDGDGNWVIDPDSIGDICCGLAKALLTNGVPGTAMACG